MATEHQEHSTTKPPVTPGKASNEQPPKARLLNGRTIVIAVLLIATLLAAIVIGPSHPVATTSAFSNVPTTTTQNQPTVFVPPECPVLRPDPTFGISLIDIQTDQPLCERNPNGIAQPASTTKIMAALLTEEYLLAHHLSLDTQVIAQKVDKQVEWDAAVAYLQVGQSYSVRLLLYMVSIISAADATMALARFVAGSRSAFLNLMNARAKQLGMLHTHYTSPYGYALTSPDNWQDGENTLVGNYSSAHDMATLMLAFARYPDLITIFGATEYHEGNAWLYRSLGHVLPDSWIGLPPPDTPSPNAVRNLHLPFQVLAAKKGCMWCDDTNIHKLSYVLLVRFRQQIVAAAFLYTTQNYFNPLIGDMLPTLLWAFHECSDPAYYKYCYPSAPVPTPSPSRQP